MTNSDAMGSKGEFAPAGFVSHNLFGVLNKKTKLPKEKKEKAPKQTGSLDSRQHKKERDTPSTKTPASEPLVANGVAPVAKEASPTHVPRQSQVHRAKKEEDRKTDRHVPRTGIRGEPAKGGAGKGNWGDQDTTPEVATPDAFPDETPEVAPPAPGAWGEADKVEVAETKVVEEEKRVQEEEKQMTLEEFRAAKAAEMVNPNKAIRKVDSSQFKNMKALAKPTDEFFHATKGKEKEKAAAPVKKVVKDERKPNAQLAASIFTMAPAEGRGRGGRGRGRGGFEGGRGRGRGGGHRSVEQSEGPKVDPNDEGAFPALPKAETAVEEGPSAAATSS